MRGKRVVRVSTEGVIRKKRGQTAPVGLPSFWVGGELFTEKELASVCCQEGQFKEKGDKSIKTIWAG